MCACVCYSLQDWLVPKKKVYINGSGWDISSLGVLYICLRRAVDLLGSAWYTYFLLSFSSFLLSLLLNISFWPVWVGYLSRVKKELVYIFENIYPYPCDGSRHLVLDVTWYPKMLNLNLDGVIIAP